MWLNLYKIISTVLKCDRQLYRVHVKGTELPFVRSGNMPRRYGPLDKDTTCDTASFVNWSRLTYDIKETTNRPRIRVLWEPLSVLSIDQKIPFTGSDQG